MRALSLRGPNDLEFRTFDAAPLAPRDVRLKSIVSAISHGTEMNTYRGTAPLDSKRFDPQLRVFVPDPGATAYPATLGYEIVSEIVEIGSDVTEFNVGDIVHTGTPHQDWTVAGVDDYLGFYPMVKLPPHETHEPGLFVSLGAVALQAAHDANAKVGDNVVVSGAGAIGLLTVQLLRMSGARVLVVEPNETRRQQALEAGAFDAINPFEYEGFVGFEVKKRLGGRGADIAIETSGFSAGLHAMIGSVGYAGTVVSVGFYQGGANDLRLGEEWHHNRITMKSSMGVWDNPHRNYPAWDRPRIMRTVVDLLYSGALRTDFMPVDHRPFDEALEVYRELSAAPTDHLKIAFDY